MDWAVAGGWSQNPGLVAKQSEWVQRKASGGQVVGDLSTLLSAIRIETAPGSARTDLKTLADKGSNPSQAETDASELVRLMGWWHGIAHVEKGLTSQTEQLETSCDKLSTAFGYEYCEPDNLLSRLDSGIRQYLQQPGTLVSSRSAWLKALSGVLPEAWGDTRRPANEVSLWDWSYAVASLYKSELARHFLTGEWRQRDQLRWRVLRVNFDVLGLYSRAIKLADLFGYMSAINAACEKTKQFLEDEYPVGNEIYRDTTGIYFTFPDVDLSADLGLELRRIAEEVEAELAPRIHVGTGQGKDASEQLRRLVADQHLEAREELAVPIDSDNFSTRWTARWENLTDGAWEVCPVCRLRPKKEEDDVCDHCQERRQLRVKGWHADPKQTIWLDELADENDRLALVVGRFGLDDWLSGDLVQTLLVKATENNPDACVSKNPSPARLRRVWETCQRFWESTVSDIFSELPDRTRWELLPSQPADAQKIRQGIVSDGTLAGQPISVFRIANQLLTVSFWPEGDGPSGGKLQVSWERGNRKQPLQPMEIQRLFQPVGGLARYATYRPTLTLLTTPDQFLALVPAAGALDLAAKIRDAYGDEFGKVQDRLPIFLGLVFFHRKTPLFAAIDTARRMLSQVELEDEQWAVECSCPSPDGQHHCLRLSQGSNRIAYKVPVKMCDKQIEDVWYPYLFVESQADNRSRRFQVKEGRYKDRWLVHAPELRPGDKLRVWPSRFGYKFLEHTAQRFEFDPQHDTMYLDELRRLTKMWNAIRGTTDMTDTRLRGVASLLEAKKDNWGNDSEEFRLLAETTLKQARLLGDKTAVTPEDVICGRFSRCLELHLRVLKQRVKGEGDGERKEAEPVSV
jgi:hypothetical protein